MEFIKAHHVRSIFVGRAGILAKLQEILDLIVAEGHGKFAYVILNIPGIGKTTTVRHFGQGLMNSHPFTPTARVPRALLVPVDLDAAPLKAPHFYAQIVQACLGQFQVFYSSNPTIFPTKWKAHLARPIQDYAIEELVPVIMPSRHFTDACEDPYQLFYTISREIPVILHLDEIQQAVDSRVLLADGTEIPKYRLVSQFVAKLLGLSVFTIITGTQFTILKKIGDHLGSPLNGKVKRLVLPRLSAREQEAYVDAVVSTPGTPVENAFKASYKNWLRRNGGGHPRTMEFMTEEFLQQLESNAWALPGETVEEDRWARFFTILDKRVMKQLKGQMWKSNYRESLREVLQAFPAQFEDLAILELFTAAEAGFQLGDLRDKFVQKFAARDISEEDIDVFLSTLVEIGYLLVNGNDNYHIPSRYAFQAFLADWERVLPGWNRVFEEFQRNTLVWEIMTYTPQSLGWALEVYLKYGFLGPVRHRDGQFPRDYAEVHGTLDDLPSWTIPARARVCRGDLTVKILEQLEDAVFYMFPLGQKFDACIKEGPAVLVMQLKSGKSPRRIRTAFREFTRDCEILHAEVAPRYRVVPWFLSLHAFDADEARVQYAGFLTAGETWERILGAGASLLQAL